MTTTSQHTQFSNAKFYPLTYVLKYDPPTIGMIYKLNENDTKKRMYKIYLHGLVYKNDPDLITCQLFEEHALHINENNVSQKQIKSLVTKLLQSRGKKNIESHGQKQAFGEPKATTAGKGNQGINIQDFGQNKGQQQQANKYQYGEPDNDNLEFDGELEDLENDDQVFEYERYGQQQKTNEKAHSKKIDFLKNLADQKNKEKDNEMDFILDDPDGLESLSDY